MTRQLISLYKQQGTGEVALKQIEKGKRAHLVWWVSRAVAVAAAVREPC